MNIANGLKNPSCRTPHFYISPKIHKEGNPGRPGKFNKLSHR